MFADADGKVLVDSRSVAEVFGKEHNHIKRDIRGPDCSDGSRQSDFGQTYYVNGQIISQNLRHSIDICAQKCYSIS